MSAVKLRDFFENQSNIALSNDRKAKIFAHINHQTQTTSQATLFSLVRNSWYFKTAATTVMAFMLTYLLYTPLSTSVLQKQQWLLVARQLTNTVQAWYLGTLLTTEGQITIMRNGEMTSTSQLQWGDDVYLYNTSKAEFVLRDGSHGSIEWPAKFTIIERKWSGIVLTLDHARYIQIDKTQSNITNTTISEELTIETSTSRITTNKDDRIHLAIVTTQDRQFIENKWDEVTIQSIIPDTKSPQGQQLASSHVAEITDLVKVYVQVAAIYDELKKQSTSKTYNLIDDGSGAIDIKKLLTFDMSKSLPLNNNTGNKDRTTVAYEDTTQITSSAVIFQSNSPKDSNKKQDIAYQDTDAAVALITADISSYITSDNADLVETIADVRDLSRQEADNVASILSDQSQILESGIKNQKIATMKINDSNTTEPSKPDSASKPLTVIHLKLLAQISSCITPNELLLLQQWFNIDSKSTIDQTLNSIKSQWYMTPAQLTKFNSLMMCDDDKN